jgi:rRNA-processing protein FCF1
MNSKLAATIVVIYGMFAFTLGSYLNNLSHQSASISQPAASSKTADNNWLINFLLSFVSLPMIPVFKEMIDAVGDQSVRNYRKNTLLDDIHKLIEIVQNAKIDSSTSEQCIKILNNLRDESYDKYLKKRDAAAKVLKRLNSGNYEIRLGDQAISEAILKHNIDSQIQNLLTKDIRNCISWLKTSLIHDRDAQYDQHELAIAKKDIGIEPYITALEYIKKELERQSEQTGVVKQFVDDLIRLMSD